MITDGDIERHGYLRGLEAAAKAAEEHSSPRFGSDDYVAVRFWHMGEDYARTEIAKAIRELKRKE
jgi:hypothetical protein